MTRLATILGVAALASPVAAQVDLPNPPLDFPFVREYWNTGNGLPQNSVNDVHRATDGYLYLATFGGLIRYDGRRFSNLMESDSLLETLWDNHLFGARLVAVFESSDGQIWMGHETGGISVWTDRTLDMFPAPPDRSMGVIKQFAEEPGGRIWFVSTTEIGYVDGTEYRLLDTPYQGTYLRDMVATGEGDLLVGTIYGLFRVESDSLVRHYPTRAAVHMVRQSPTGDIWFSMGDSILSMNDAGEVTSHLTTDGALPGPMTDASFRIDGQVIIGGSGLFLSRENGDLLDIGNQLMPVQEGGTLVYSIWDVESDHEHNTWLGTRGAGLIKLRSRLGRVYGTAQGLTSAFRWCS